MRSLMVAMTGISLLLGCRGGKPIAQQIEHSFCADIDAVNMFHITVMTKRYPKDGSQGGVMGQYTNGELMGFFPEIGDYDEKKDSIVWFYEIKPIVVKLDSGCIEVHGEKTSDGKMWYCIVPKAFVDDSDTLYVLERPGGR